MCTHNATVEYPARGALLASDGRVEWVGPDVGAAGLLVSGDPGRGLAHIVAGDDRRAARIERAGKSLSYARAAARRKATKTGRPVCVAEVVKTDTGEPVRLLLAAKYLVEPVALATLTEAAKLAAPHVLEAAGLKPVAKEVNPLTPQGFDALTKTLAEGLYKKAAPVSRAEVVKLLKSLDVDWAKATDAELLVLSKRINGAMRKVAGETWLGTRATLYHVGDQLANGTRAATIRRWDVPISARFSQRDLEAIRRVTASQAHYVTNFYTKNIAKGMSAEARRIVRNGLSQGLGSRDIGATLHKALGEYLPGRERAYFNVVASTYVNRARSYSQLITYNDGGIEFAIWDSVLDEVTTETCRFMDGRIFDVKRGLEQFEAVDSAADPRDVRLIQPWIRERKILTGPDAGKKGLFVPKADGSFRKMAVVERSAMGKLDERGTFSTRHDDNRVPADVGPPPGHGS